MVRHPFVSCQQLGLAVGPARLLAPRQAVGSPHSGSLRVQLQQAGAPLQLQVARRHLGSCGLPPPPRQALARGRKLVQPPMGVARRPGSQASAVGGGSDCNRTVLAQEGVVQPPRRDVLRVQRHASEPRPLLSAEATRTRWGRALRLERHRLPSSTPPWMLLGGRALHEGHHLPRTRGAAAQGAQGRGGINKRPRRYLALKHN